MKFQKYSRNLKLMFLADQFIDKIQNFKKLLNLIEFYLKIHNNKNYIRYFKENPNYL